MIIAFYSYLSDSLELKKQYAIMQYVAKRITRAQCLDMNEYATDLM